MTMQSTTLPFQVSGANPLAQQQPQRNAAAGAQADAGQFGATLSREIAQRQAGGQNAAPAPSPASNNGKPAAPAKQQAAEKAASQGPKAAAREPARNNEGTASADAPTDAAQAGTAESADGATEAAAAAESAAAAAAAAAESAANPVTDMLAFMASLAQPAQAATAAPVAAEAAAAPAAAAGAELQLAALQSAFAKLDGASGAAAATDPALAGATEGQAEAGGFSLAAGVQPAAADGANGADAADLRAVQQTAQAAVPADAAKLQAQVRDGAAQAAAAAEAPAPAVTQLQAQAAKLEALANPAAPSDRIPARVGSQAWDNQVSQRIVYMVGKEQAATLTLNPPDLGPVQVVLNVSNDQASVAFSSSQLEVRQALENALPRLREMMSESGISLGNASVDAGVPDGRQAQDGERRHAGGTGATGRDTATGSGDSGAARPATRTVALGERGMVDTFA